MKYNFDEIIPRRNTNSVKWDEAAQDDIIPLWVADMDFRVLPQITEALRQRVDHGVFGYTHVPDSYYESVWVTRGKAIGYNLYIGCRTCYFGHRAGIDLTG